MIDKHLIERKLQKIDGYLKELKSVSIESFQELTGNKIVKRFVERNIELSIEQMLDICKHLISGLDLKNPETYAECFDFLGEAEVIPMTNVPTFKSMARYKNLLVHAYDDIDDSITYGIFKKHLEDFNDFVIIVREFISNWPLKSS